MDDYVELLGSEPALPPGAEPGHWKASSVGRSQVTLTYRIRLTRLGSEEQRAHGLLPTWSPAYTFGYSWNTLVRVTVDGEVLANAPTIRIEAPSGESIVTGWAGRSTGPQRAVLDAALGNAPIAFGAPAVERLEERAGIPLEIRQFGGGPDVTEMVAEVLAACAPAFERAFDYPARRPYRAFVTDTQGGGMGSHYGLRIGVMADAPADHAQTPWLRGHVAHELLHDWLGIALTEENSQLVWFKEGFTEYLALWQATAAALVERDWFAQRLFELESIARTRSAAGSVSFGDPNVTWRDGDGPNETLVYTGAPLLALRADAELRVAGHAGLPALVRDLLASADGPYDLEDLRKWFHAHDLEARWDASVAGAELPDVAESLALAGYATIEEPADLTYFGLRTDGDRPGCTVLAVDPDGPAHAAGLRVGDVLTGWFPARAQPATANAADNPYPFGLGAFDPSSAANAFLGVLRNGVNEKTFVQPVVQRGAGHVRRLDATAPALDEFFRFEPHAPPDSRPPRRREPPK